MNEPYSVGLRLPIDVHRPGQRFAGVKQNRPFTGFESRVPKLERRRRFEAHGNDLFLFHEREGFSVRRKTVEPGPMLTGKTLETIQGPLLFENGGVALESMHRVEDAGTSTGRFLT